MGSSRRCMLVAEAIFLNFITQVLLGLLRHRVAIGIANLPAYLIGELLRFAKEQLECSARLEGEWQPHEQGYARCFEIRHFIRVESTWFHHIGNREYSFPFERVMINRHLSELESTQFESVLQIAATKFPIATSCHMQGDDLFFYRFCSRLLDPAFRIGSQIVG